MNALQQNWKVLHLRLKTIEGISVQKLLQKTTMVLD